MPTPGWRTLRSVTHLFIPHLVVGVQVPEQATRTRQEVTDTLSGVYGLYGYEHTCVLSCAIGVEAPAI